MGHVGCAEVTLRDGHRTPNYGTSINAVQMLLAVIHWHRQLLHRTLPGANSCAGAKPPPPSAGTRGSWNPAWARGEPQHPQFRMGTCRLLACLPALCPWPLSAGDRALPWSRVCGQCPSLGTLQPHEQAGTEMTPVPAAVEAPRLPQPGNGDPQGQHGCANSEQLRLPDSRRVRRDTAQPELHDLGTRWSLCCCQ